MADATYGAIRQLALVDAYLSPVDNALTVLGSITITPTNGAIAYTDIDFGFPDVRSSVQENPQQSGTFDQTQYTGASLVTISGIALQGAFGDEPALSNWPSSINWNSASYWLRILASYANPARRLRLYFTDDSDTPRFMEVRGDSFSAPIDKSSAGYRQWQMGLVNPSGKAYYFDTTPGRSTIDGRSVAVIGSETIIGTNDPNPGRDYPEEYPKDYPPLTSPITAPPPATTYIDYTGTVSTGFRASVTAFNAPIANPRLQVTAPNGSTQSIGLSYTVPVGATVVFDTEARTITQTGAQAQSLEQYKTAPLQWPTLQPGIDQQGFSGRNRFGFFVNSASQNASINVSWYNADLG